MALTAATMRESIRRMYRDGGADDAARNAWMDGLSDTAQNRYLSGKLLTSSSDKGTSAGYQMFANWTPQEITDLVDRLRAYTDYADADAALAVFAYEPVAGIATAVTSSHWNA